jgi:hypothetical protein
MSIVIIASREIAGAMIAFDLNKINGWIFVACYHDETNNSKIRGHVGPLKAR